MGRLAVLSLAFGAAVASLQFLVDGYALTALADSAPVRAFGARLMPLKCLKIGE